jgi:hypothetical protein
VQAAVVCLGLALLGSMLSFTLPAAPSSSPPPLGENTPAGKETDWGEYVRRGCGQLADIANFGVLSRVPGLCEESREIIALMKLLNTPQEKLQVLAEKNGLLGLADVPEVREALTDEEYMYLIQRFEGGDMSSLVKLAKNPITERLLASPRIRELAPNLRPSKLVEELEGLPDPVKE